MTKVHIDHGNTRMILDLDEQGRFSTVLPPGSYDVAVFDDDHDSVASGLDLKDGETVSNLRFELPAPAAADDDSGEGG